MSKPCNPVPADDLNKILEEMKKNIIKGVMKVYDGMESGAKEQLAANLNEIRAASDALAEQGDALKQQAAEAQTTLNQLQPETQTPPDNPGSAGEGSDGA